MGLCHCKGLKCQRETVLSRLSNLLLQNSPKNRKCQFMQFYHLPVPHHTSSGIYKTLKKHGLPTCCPETPEDTKIDRQLTSRPSHWGWQTTFLLGWRIIRRLTGSNAQTVGRGVINQWKNNSSPIENPVCAGQHRFFDGNLYFFWPFTIPSLQVKPCEQVSATNLRWTLMTFAPGLRWWASKRGLKSRRSEWVHLQPQT